MKEGERQVAPTIDGIRRDHVARYEWAAEFIPAGLNIIDFACGVGYGCKILADAGHRAHGFDIDYKAIDYANEHYKVLNATLFSLGNSDAAGPFVRFDAAVCFETIEHIQNPRPLLKVLHESVPQLLVSVPNEAVLPWRDDEGKTTDFHFRHYTKNEFKALLMQCGWRVVAWYGQDGPESDVEAGLLTGRTILAACVHLSKKIKKKPQRAPAKQLPADTPQLVLDGQMLEEKAAALSKHICIVGLGGSANLFVDVCKSRGGRHVYCDEVWGINAMGGVLDCDLVFHMDDVRIQEIRAKARPDSNIAHMLKWMKTSKVPIVTSRAHPDYPALIEFPLEECLNIFGHDYFNSTAAYAVCYAMYKGTTEISCFGMDFSYENVHDAEKGRACVEYWLGQAHARGVQVYLPKTTSLMDANCPKEARLYGYDTLDIHFDHNEKTGELKLEMTPKEDLPTAEEIEKRYDHSAPIDKQHVNTNSEGKSHGIA